MKNILCFGDSNTNGASSEVLGKRLEWGERWTSLLQIGLGFEDYRIIEDGIGGRSTVFKNAFSNVTCGIDSLPYSLAAHRPLDMIIISLGTNDTQVPYNSPTLCIVRGYENLITMIKNDCFEKGIEMPKIFILSPPLIGNTDLCPFPGYDKSSEKKMRELIPEHEKFAKINGYQYFDASKITSTGADNIHFTKSSHVKLANELIPIIKESFK
jgi:lysophospholipase L1-like esterase